MLIEFTRDGYQSAWKANKTGMAGVLVRGLGKVLSGVLGNPAAGGAEFCPERGQKMG